jgi:outer membrane lipoprotein carrier protein
MRIPSGRLLVLGALVLGLGVPSRADAPDVTKLLAGIEDRYNHTQTLQVGFTEVWTLNGRKRSGSGTLFLRKPGRMRWEYTMPAGRLFISDGEFIYSYSPEENRAEKIKMKSVEDMRAPLAFLLGRLNFHDDFREFHASPQGDGVFITALPKSGKLPYTEVSFLTGSGFAIQKLEVKGQDNSVIQYTFDGEKTNTPIPDSMFRFTPPPGVEYVDSSRQ